jgi:Ser-tRNA(Ala) deacylase AlaX
MTAKLFWEDPYRTELDTIISSVDRNQVTVTSTIFFAFSGGQESDAGSIAGHPVLEARKEGLEIVYSLPDGHGLHPGDRVRMEIDWKRRYRLMRLHFAAELVLELVYRSLAGVEKVGAHIAVDKARLDFRWPENISRYFPALLSEAQSLIDADLKIVSAYEDEASETRYWEVAGFARVPCGGTHLRRTGEVGRIALKRNNIGHAKERIEIYLLD